MTLEGLIRKTRDQTSKIDENMGCFTDAEPVWALLRDSLWGKGLEFLELSTREVRKLTSLQDRDSLSGVTPSTHPIVRLPETMPDLWDFDSFHILARPEYKEVEQAAVTANSRGVDLFLVAGQSGISAVHLIQPSAEPNI